MSVYRNDKPVDFRLAVESISIRQTVKPAEVLIVVDGPVPEALQAEIVDISNTIDLVRVLWLKENKGLGRALQHGVREAAYDIVARMDSDDIAVPDRFGKQIAAFEADSELCIVGGNIDEFIDTPNNIVGKREVPPDHDSICRYMKKRCALNHVTVMFRKGEVLRVGNYQDWFWNEDYYLWIRMMLGNCKFANIPEPLVNVRVGKDMYARRGGMAYFKSEEGLQRYMLKHGLINLPLYCFNVLVRFVVQVVMPNQLRAFVFQKLFRKK